MDDTESVAASFKGCIAEVNGLRLSVRRELPEYPGDPVEYHIKAGDGWVFAEVVTNSEEIARPDWGEHRHRLAAALVRAYARERYLKAG